MVLSIARQSVIIKCNMQKSIITGNYEYFYAAGLLSKLTGIEIPEDISPLQLADLLDKQEKNIITKDEKEDYLKKILLDYMPQEEYDEQMKELFLWGKGEEHLWEVTAPST